MFKRIIDSIGGEAILDKITSQLSGTDFASFLLEVFRRRAEKIAASDLLQQFRDSRFVATADMNCIGYKEIELVWLRYAKRKGFEPVIFSPVAPLGSCSAIAPVNQNKIVSAARNTEVVADITNMMALKTAEIIRSKSDENNIIRLASAHRHIRAQAFPDPSFAAHFGVLCLTSGGLDTGNYSFELSQLKEHLNYHYKMLASCFDSARLTTRIYISDKRLADPIDRLLKKIAYSSPAERVNEPLESNYYFPLQFKIFLTLEDAEIDLADGGVVDWTQQLLSNKKHRFFISASGIERVYKLAYIE
ncbi:MAG: hypothetical protein ACRBF0_17360 [Calditrichia bacterium]